MERKKNEFYFAGSFPTQTVFESQKKRFLPKKNVF
jgi:hypothetical protein